MSEYLTKDCNIAYVAQTPFTGDFTFYIRKANQLKQRGTRVKGKSQSLYFHTKSEAEKALGEYAKKRGWRKICLTG
jgi:hypothetical protein